MRVLRCWEWYFDLHCMLCTPECHLRKLCCSQHFRFPCFKLNCKEVAISTVKCCERGSQTALAQAQKLSQQLPIFMQTVKAHEEITGSFSCPLVHPE